MMSPAEKWSVAASPSFALRFEARELLQMEAIRSWIRQAPLGPQGPLDQGLIWGIPKLAGLGKIPNKNGWWLGVSPLMEDEDQELYTIELFNSKDFKNPVLGLKFMIEHWISMDLGSAQSGEGHAQEPPHQLLGKRNCHEIISAGDIDGMEQVCKLGFWLIPGEEVCAIAAIARLVFGNFSLKRTKWCVTCKRSGMVFWGMVCNPIPLIFNTIDHWSQWNVVLFPTKNHGS